MVDLMRSVCRLPQNLNIGLLYTYDDRRLAPTCTTRGITEIATYRKRL